MKERPKISDDEIRSYMNFDALLGQHRAQQESTRKWLKNTMIAVALLGAGAFVYYALPVEETVVKDAEPPTQAPATTQIDSIQHVEPEVQKPGKQPSEINPQRVNPAAKTSADKTKIEKEKFEEMPTDALPTTVDYREAEPVKGYPDLYAYFSRELKYPEAALLDSIPVQGVVSVSFVVDKEGKPVKISIQNSLGPLFDSEAKRLIENMPQWRPASLNGKPVPAKIAVPLTFQVEKINPERK